MTIFSTLASGYYAAGMTTTTKAKYVNVDPKLYEGTWSGTYSNGKKFSITVSSVKGFRAQVKYQSGSTVTHQSVLIKSGSFRVGDTKFTLGTNGKASIRTAVTDPASGSVSLITGSATRS